MFNKISVTLLLVLLPLATWAQTYQLGQPQFSGTGCPPGAAALLVSPDGSQLSVLFDQFHMAAKPNFRVMNLTCNITVPMTVTSGYMVDTTFVDYRGYAMLSGRGGVRLSTSGFNSLNRVTGRFMASSVINGPIQDSVFIRQSVRQSMPGNRKCPSQQELTLNIRAEFMFNRGMSGEMEFTLDSADVGGEGLTVGIQLRPCRLQK